MKVIIDIPDDATVIEVTAMRIYVDDGEVYLDTTHIGSKVSELEKVEVDSGNERL